MNIALIIFNLIAWPFTYVFMAVGFSRWFLEVSITGLLILTLLLLLFYKIPKFIRIGVFLITALSMLLTNTIPLYLPHIYAILIPILALCFLAVSHQSKSYETFLFNVYLMVCFSYVFISGVGFLINYLTMIFYHTFIEELPVLDNSFSLLNEFQTNFIVLVSSILVILPSLASILGLRSYRKKHA